MTTIQAILFDKDGTLFDFHATWGKWAKQFFIEICGGDVRRARGLAAVSGFDFDRVRYRPDSPIISATPQQIAAILIPHLPEYTSAQVIEQMNKMSRVCEPVQATPLQPLLFELRQRALKLGVVTNDSVDSARTHLRSAHVEGLFDQMLGCDSGFLPKPEPDMLRVFCEMVDVLPEHVAMVGDSAGDLIAARRAGMFAIGVLTGPAPKAVLEPLADVVLPSIEFLPSWLDRRESFAA